MTFRFDDDPDRAAPLWSFGFRPFFLAAGIYAVIAIVAWLAWLGIHAAGGAVVSPTIAVAPHLWHAHEMLFGYAGAALCGFLLTAVPSWTGARRVAGFPLMVLVAVWLAGRMAMWFSALLPAGLVALVDLACLALLLAYVVAAMVVKPAARNLVFPLLITALIAGNGLFHGEWLGWVDDGARLGARFVLATFALLVVIIGGRIVPAFTRNALMRRGETRLPRKFAWLDRASIIAAAALPVAVIAGGDGSIVGGVALVAGLCNLARWSLWRWSASLADSLVWSLHVAYLWLPAGYLAIAAAGLGDWLAMSSAEHFLAIGAVGGMTLAVMTRAALGHTGRALKASPATTAAYVLVGAAALLRGIGVEALPDGYFAIIIASGVFWIAGFALFAAVYAPILVGPSRKGDNPAQVMPEGAKEKG